LVQLARHGRSGQLRLRSLRRQGNGPSADWRSQATALLRARAGTLHSSLLVGLAAQISQDPFIKVKQMIQNLIERLLAEAQSEANHKGWCDQQVALATQARDASVDSIREVNGRLEVSEARRAKLSEMIQTLDIEVQTLNETLANSSAIREQERVDNQAAIQDAQAGRDAVVRAADILFRFYAAARSASSRASGASLMASGNVTLSSVEQDAPDAGFNEAYSGAQGAKEGILGMLDVIKSDFERTIRQTQAVEATAVREFYELQTTAGSSMAAKGQAREARAASLRSADSEYRDNGASLAQYQDRLDSALNELEALREPCMGGGPSPEERKIQREEEMSALRRVLCILDQHGVGGIEHC